MRDLNPRPWVGGPSPRQFLDTVWQRRPWLLRGAIPGAGDVVDRQALFGLAAREEVESRLVVQAEGGTWRLRHGPFNRRQLPALARPCWTLLVQGVDLHVPAAHELMSRFRFLGDARLDDVMVSYASDGGGVGAHVDSYDVFLLQLHGRRRWRVGPVRDATLVPDRPVKLLAHFEATEQWCLEPGDMLYVPPGWGHDGVAEGECMTASIGFRAPGRQGLRRELLPLVAEILGEAEAEDTLYRDPARRPSPAESPARVPPAMQAFARAAVRRALQDDSALDCALGEWLSEPKPSVWFDAGGDLPPGHGVVLDRRSRMLHDARHVYVNGESFRASGRDASLMRRLADARRLSAAEVRQLGPQAMALLQDWVNQGWVHDDGAA